MEDNRLLVLKKNLEKELIECIQKFTTNTKIHDILKKADEECIILNDSAINAKGFRGMTPLTLSIWSRDDFSVKHLIDNYPNLIVDTTDASYESNALFLALRHDYIDVAEKLIEKGFNINQKLDKKQYDGNTIFMQLCNPKPYMSLSEDTLIYIFDNMKPDLTITNEKGQNALDILLEKCAPHCRKSFTPMLEKAILIIEEKNLFEKIITKPKKESKKLKV